MSSRPRALLVATIVCENGMGMARALQTVGFRVAAHCPAFHLLRQVRDLEVVESGRQWLTQEHSLCRSLQKWQPDILLPCDDPSVRALHAIHGKFPQWAALIEKSLGSPHGFPICRSRADFLATMAEARSASLPQWSRLRNQDDLHSLLKSCSFPLVFKREASSGGSGVRIVRTIEKARLAYRELTMPLSLLHRFRRRLQDGILGVVQDRPQNWSHVVAQSYIPGQPANRSVLCRKGRVVAGINVEAVQCFRENGAATVVRRIEHEEMEATAAAAVERLAISGFCGFDFILESGTRRAWLLEMNPRLTPISHLCFEPMGQPMDLAASLFQMCTPMCTGRAAARPPSPSGKNVVLFPQELARDRQSPHLSGNHHDVPWDDLPLVAACARRASQTDTYSGTRKFFTSARKFLPEFLLRQKNSAFSLAENVPEPRK